MSFFSFQFILFFLGVICFYWIIRNHRYQNYFLLIASLVFFGWGSFYVPAIFLGLATGLYLCQRLVALTSKSRVLNHGFYLRQFAQQEFKTKVSSYCQQQPQRIQELEVALQKQGNQIPTHLDACIEFLQRSSDAWLTPLKQSQQDLLRKLQTLKQAQVLNQDQHQISEARKDFTDNSPPLAKTSPEVNKSSSEVQFKERATSNSASDSASVSESDSTSYESSNTKVKSEGNSEQNLEHKSKAQVETKSTSQSDSHSGTDKSKKAAKRQKKKSKRKQQAHATEKAKLTPETTSAAPLSSSNSSSNSATDSSSNYISSSSSNSTPTSSSNETARVGSSSGMSTGAYKVSGGLANSSYSISSAPEPKGSNLTSPTSTNSASTPSQVQVPGKELGKEQGKEERANGTSSVPQHLPKHIPEEKLWLYQYQEFADLQLWLGTEITLSYRELGRIIHNLSPDALTTSQLLELNQQFTFLDQLSKLANISWKSIQEHHLSSKAKLSGETINSGNANNVGNASKDIYGTASHGTASYDATFYGVDSSASQPSAGTTQHRGYHGHSWTERCLEKLALGVDYSFKMVDRGVRAVVDPLRALLAPFLDSILLPWLRRDKYYATVSFTPQQLLSWTPSSNGGWFNLVLGVSLLPLIYYKYSDAIIEYLSSLFASLGIHLWGGLLDVIPLIGISYLTFNSISLLVAVKRGELRAVGYLEVLTFFCYFPAVLSGPIMRATYLLPKLYRPRQLGNLGEIFYYLTMGLLKIWLLAAVFDQGFVREVFSSPESYHSLELVLGVFGYAFVLYFNFSGYTDLMQAIALSLGIRNYQNFNQPYLTTSIKNFWDRWHISLSTWIRDYIYIPLGGNRHGFVKAQLYTVIAMILSGIWHGNKLTFVVWGLLHTLGILIVNLVHHYSHFRLSKISNGLARWVTFLYLGITWIFFNAEDWNTALSYCHGLLFNWDAPLAVSNSVLSLLLMLGYIQLQPQFYKTATQLRVQAMKRPLPLVVGISTLALGIIISLAPSGLPSFIYAGF